jgi:hypothetical protein
MSDPEEPAVPPTPNPPADLVGRRFARHLASELAALTARRRAVVLLADPATGTELDRHVVGPPPGPIDGDALLALVLPSQATVCDAGRLHEPGLRCLAHQWRCTQLLIAPCTFGHALVGLAIVAVAPNAEPLPIERAARPLVDRFATAIVGTRLFTNAAARDSLLISIGA